MNLLASITSAFRPSTLSAESPIRNPACAEFEIDAWQVSRFVAEKLVPIVGAHPFPLHELMLMVGAVCLVRPTHIFEWGTHIGKSARAFYETVTHFHIPCELHSVDLPDDVPHVEHPADARGGMVRGLSRVHLHQGDGVDVALRIWRTAGQPKRVLFFLDGDHAEDSVYRELSTIVAAAPSPSALVHDTFYQSMPSGYNTGPHQAVSRVLHSQGDRFKRVDSGLGLPGMTFIYPAG